VEGSRLGCGRATPTPRGAGGALGGVRLRASGRGFEAIREQGRAREWLPVEDQRLARNRLRRRKCRRRGTVDPIPGRSPRGSARWRKASVTGAGRPWRRVCVGAGFRDGAAVEPLFEGTAHRPVLYQWDLPGSPSANRPLSCVLMSTTYEVSKILGQDIYCRAITPTDPFALTCTAEFR
jgi:hypothetical protein